MTRTLTGVVLVTGSGEGNALICAEPLSLWGGLDPQSGKIIDQRHPRAGAVVSDRILVLPWGRGSSSSSSILLEAVRLHTAPNAILLREPDGILALGAAVARELYQRCPPIVVLDTESHGSIEENQRVVVRADGTILVGD